MTSNQKGAFFMVVAMTLYTLNDAIVKVLGDAFPLSQILVLRGGIATLLLVAAAACFRQLQRPHSWQAWGLLTVRTFAEAGGTYFFLSALLLMPLANATAILQALPLLVTLGAAVLFGERVGWRRMLAIGLGFGGMLLIIRPGPQGFADGTFYAILGVCLISVRELITRKLPAQLSSMTIAVSVAAGVTVLGGVLSVGQDWVPVTLSQGFLMVTTSLFILLGYVVSVTAMRFGDVSFTAPFRYSGLIVALIVGFFLFEQWPDGVTLLGAAIVVAAGLFTLFREKPPRVQSDSTPG